MGSRGDTRIALHLLEFRMQHLPYVYLAGKIARDDWRTELVDMPHVLDDGPFPYLPMVGFDAVYTGPMYCSLGGHGVAHGPNQHGSITADQIDTQRYLVARRCLAGIRDADMVFAWLDDLTCYGTLVEIGIAWSAGKYVYLGYDREFVDDDLWFARQLANDFQSAATPTGGLRKALESYREYLRTMPYDEYLLTPIWKRRRQVALDAAGGRCQACNISTNLRVHHRTYDRRGSELPSDLTVFCDACHAKFHNKPAPSRIYVKGERVA